MADEFRIESQGAKTIRVRHVELGRLYTFRVSLSRTAHRTLKGGHSPRFGPKLHEKARAFAEQEAKKVGLID